MDSKIPFVAGGMATMSLNTAYMQRRVCKTHSHALAAHTLNLLVADLGGGGFLGFHGTPFWAGLSTKKYW